jgi:hypothetical protein
MGIYHFHNCHRTNQKEHDLGGGGNRLVELPIHQAGIGAQYGVYRPEQRCTDQGRSRLVDFDLMLERNRDVCANEDRDYCAYQKLIPLNLLVGEIDVISSD